MSIPWIPIPREGTSVLDGEWFCTVKCGVARPRLKVSFMRLRQGVWFWPSGKPLTDQQTITAVSNPPEPYRKGL